MTAMDDLVAWLREQIADDERVAKAARGHTTGQWEPDGNLVRARATYHDISVVKWSWPQEIAHIVQHDPAAVLAQCEAHTALLDAHTHGPAEPRPGAQPSYDFGCADCHTSDDGEQWGYGWCASVRALALAYQHRPGYREEWRP